MLSFDPNEAVASRDYSNVYGAPDRFSLSRDVPFEGRQIDERLRHSREFLLRQVIDDLDDRIGIHCIRILADSRAES